MVSEFSEGGKAGKRRAARRFFSKLLRAFAAVAVAAQHLAVVRHGAPAVVEPAAGAGKRYAGVLVGTPRRGVRAGGGSVALVATARRQDTLGTQAASL